MTTTARAPSSIGQSSRLITGRFQVRVLGGPISREENETNY